jgi:hypothetical protein
MQTRALWALTIAIVLSGCAKSSAPVVAANSWKVSIFDVDHRAAGTIVLHVTTRTGTSCLGGFEDSKLVVIDRATDLLPAITISRFPVAKIDGDNFSFDLSGGICDAYVLLHGKVLTDGSAAGKVSTLSLGGGETLGTFVAVREE